MANNPKRKTLSLTQRNLSTEAANSITTLGVYDCQLPCRQFSVQYKASILGKISLTSEFMLRLLKSVEVMDEQEAASFFGFNYREMSYILKELENFGYVSRNKGKLSLSPAGEELFLDDTKFPSIYEIEERSTKLGVNLVSLSLEKRKYLSVEQRRYPELQILDQKSSSDGVERAKVIFRRNFIELSGFRDTDPRKRPSLYSIDDIEPSERFASSLRVWVGSKRKSPSSIEVTLFSDWETIEMKDRVEILRSAKEFASKLETQKHESDDRAYKALTDTAEDFLAEWTRKDGLSKNRYYRECVTRVGEVRSDRETIPVVGSLFVKENTRRLLDQIKYTDPEEDGCESIFWLAPDVPNWGATTSLTKIVMQLQKDFRSLDKQPESIGVIPDALKWHVEKTFDVIEKRISDVPKGLEILLIPNHLCSVVVHAPLNVTRGLPVPLGFISRDKKVVERTTEIIKEYCPEYISRASCG